MIVPTFWARRDFTCPDAQGYTVTRSALGWSLMSQADADAMAASRAERFARAEAADTHDADALYYNVMPLREPVLDTLAVAGETVAIVTRNRYGCRVLNAASVCFADVDLTPPWRVPLTRSRWRRIVELWVRPSRPPAVDVGPDLEQTAVARVREWHARTRTPVRVYRTFAGLRLMLVGERYEPTDPATLRLLRDLDSDPLYVQLTKRQDCFRARLSPKPWRVGVRVPASPSQIDHPDYPQALARWAVDYERTASAYATCRLIDTLGEIADDPAIRGVIAMHDRHVLAADGRPLA